MRKKQRKVNAFTREIEDRNRFASFRTIGAPKAFAACHLVEDEA